MKRKCLYFRPTTRRRRRERLQAFEQFAHSLARPGQPITKQLVVVNGQTWEQWNFGPDPARPAPTGPPILSPRGHMAQLLAAQAAQKAGQ